MNFGFVITVQKFRTACPKLAVCPAPERPGSLKKSRTAKNIKNTLSAESRKTFSTLRCRWTHEAKYGPAAPPMLTSV